MLRRSIFFLLICLRVNAWTQEKIIIHVLHDGMPLELASVFREQTGDLVYTDKSGSAIFEVAHRDEEKFVVSMVGFKTDTILFERDNQKLERFVELLELPNILNELVVTGTMKEVSQANCMVPIEVYRSSYFSKLPTPNLFEALSQVNGIRPQMNCGVCNTGDIRMNGLPGGNTMILIDGMPIVSALGTVYGLNGIPTSLIERLEIVRGPASALYGSEAIGGIINVITKKAENAPLFFIDMQSSSWLEHQIDISTKTKVGRKWSVLMGANVFHFNQAIDRNNDGFMDMSQVSRVSGFSKWQMQRKSGKILQFAGRYVYEDRLGGQLLWTPQDRGGNRVYGESIYTSRFEILGLYELPVKEKMLLSFSWNRHDQNSYYGEKFYLANQEIGFLQWTWEKKIKSHDLLIGAAWRRTFYDDNSVATAEWVDGSERNLPSIISLPGLFIQDEIRGNEKHSFLLEVRLDHSAIHGYIPTGRIGHKWNINPSTLLRTNAGTGFRNVNVFAEDHAALTGARTVVFLEALRPEQSASIQSQILHKKQIGNSVWSMDASIFYYYFTNQIIADYDRNPEQIVYANLNGFSHNGGVSMNTDYSFGDWWLRTGVTFMDRRIVEEDVSVVPILTEHVNAVWTISKHFDKGNWSVDYTGNLYSPMRLPLLGDLDPRKEYSPWWQIHNIQVKKQWRQWEIYAAVRNVLDMVPWKDNPFIIANANDPFDQNVVFDETGNVLPTAENPYALTFDPSYIFTMNQGRRLVFGVRFTH